MIFDLPTLEFLETQIKYAIELDRIDPGTSTRQGLDFALMLFDYCRRENQRAEHDAARGGDFTKGDE